VNKGCWPSKTVVDRLCEGTLRGEERGLRSFSPEICRGHTTAAQLRKAVKDHSEAEEVQFVRPCHSAFKF
jgi:hypothetical protein